MQKLDQYIDEHGGTPTAPKETNDTGTRISSSEIPSGYSITQTIDTTNYIAK